VPDPMEAALSVRQPGKRLDTFLTGEIDYLASQI